MNIQINSNAFTKLNKMVGISTVKLSIKDYQLVDETLEGTIVIEGEYYCDDEAYDETNGLKEFQNLIPFTIIFKERNPLIQNIEIKNFEYFEVAGRGIEASFDIEVEYQLPIIEEKIISQRGQTEINNKCDDNSDDIEKYKEEITSKIDDLLATKLELKTDNFPEKTPSKRESKTSIRIVYYKEHTDVKDLCKVLNVPYEKVLDENKKYESSKNHRIIVSE